MGILEYVYEGNHFFTLLIMKATSRVRNHMGTGINDLGSFPFFCKAALSSLPVIGF